MELRLIFGSERLTQFRPSAYMYNKQKVTVIVHYSVRPRVEHNKITIFQTAFKLLR